MPLATSTIAATDNERHPPSSQDAPPSTATPAIDSNALTDQKKKRGRHKPRNKEEVQTTAGEGEAQNASTSGSQPHRNDRQQSQDPTAQGRRGPRRRRPAPVNATNKTQASDTAGNADLQSGRSTPHAPGTGVNREGRSRQHEGEFENSAPKTLPRGGGRRRNINAKLTDDTGGNRQEKPEGPSPAAARRPREREPKADNLTNRLIDSLKTPPYADCPICFNSIHPAQPIWSCTPDTHQSTPFGKTAASLLYFFLIVAQMTVPKTLLEMRNVAIHHSI